MAQLEVRAEILGGDACSGHRGGHAERGVAGPVEHKADRGSSSTWRSRSRLPLPMRLFYRKAQVTGGIGTRDPRSRLGAAPDFRPQVAEFGILLRDQDRKHLANRLSGTVRADVAGATVKHLVVGADKGGISVIAVRPRRRNALRSCLVPHRSQV